jgi:hypothetical protein
MKRIKAALDPNNIMNPGKLIPPHVCIWLTSPSSCPPAWFVERFSSSVFGCSSWRATVTVRPLDVSFLQLVGSVIHQTISCVTGKSHMNICQDCDVKINWSMFANKTGPCVRNKKQQKRCYFLEQLRWLYAKLSWASNRCPISHNTGRFTWQHSPAIHTIPIFDLLVPDGQFIHAYVNDPFSQAAFSAMLKRQSFVL